MKTPPAPTRHWECKCGYRYDSPRPIRQCQHTHHLTKTTDEIVNLKPVTNWAPPAGPVQLGLEVTA